MPLNGEINSEFGVYRSLCCGDEIVIVVGARFPDCPNKHPRLTRTQWKSLNRSEKTSHISDELFPDKSREDSAA